MLRLADNMPFGIVVAAVAVFQDEGGVNFLLTWTYWESCCVRPFAFFLSPSQTKHLILGGGEGGGRTEEGFTLY